MKMLSYLLFANMTATLAVAAGICETYNSGWAGSWEMSTVRNSQFTVKYSGDKGLLRGRGDLINQSLFRIFFDHQGGIKVLCKSMVGSRINWACDANGIPVSMVCRGW